MTNSIGAFLATMRKSKGMTQQDVADTLHVSNKTISKWERDESSPDLAAIPVLAELFEVSCDEILRGAKNSPAAVQDPDVPDKKVEEREKWLEDKSVTAFINRALIALTIIIAGGAVTVLLFYSAERLSFPFGIACAITAAVMINIAYNNVRTALGDSVAPVTRLRISRWFQAIMFGSVCFLLLSLISYLNGGGFYTPDYVLIRGMVLVAAVGMVWVSLNLNALVADPEKYPHTKKLNLIHCVSFGFIVLLALINNVWGYYGGVAFIVLTLGVASIAVALGASIRYIVKNTEFRAWILFESFRNVMAIIALCVAFG